MKDTCVSTIDRSGGQPESLSATCQCGKVAFELAGAPILVAACYCTSCQRAGHAFEKMPAAPAVLDADGGTPLIVYRKDRIRCVQGREYLEERRLKPTSPTRRVFAICCNSAMFADFTKGHWLSLYRKRFDADAPPVQMRLMTAERRGDVVLGEDLPNYRGRPGNFLWKLIATWAAMGFRRPDMGLADLPRSIFQNGDPNGRP
jgi:hypothetical protein